MKKRVIGIMLSTALTVSMLAGCGASKPAVESTADKSEEVKVEETSSSSSVSEESKEEERPLVTFTAVIFEANPPADVENTETLKEIEELFNVRIEVECAAADPATFANKMRMLAVAGDLPDIIHSYDAQIINEFADEGFLLPLTEDITSQVPGMTEMFTEKELQSLMYKGEMYQFPQALPAAYNSLYVRGDWMENLGLEVPTTIEEFENMLYQFTYGDPDGNGIDDTYGYGERNALSANFSPIFSAHGIVPHYWQESEGHAVYGFTHPKMFEVLELLASWYEQKLIDPEFVTSTTDDWWSKIATGKVGCFAAGIGSYGGIMQRFADAGSDGYVISIPVPVVEEGVGGMYAYGSVKGGLALNKDIENVDRLLEVMAYLYDVDNLLALQLGEEGVDWKRLPEGGYESIKTSEEKTNSGRGFYVMNLSPFNGLNCIPEMQDNRVKACYEMYENGVDDIFVDFVRPTREVNLSEKYGDINSILLNGMFEVVCGKTSVEDYQTFIDTWYASGGEEITKEADEDYQLMLEQRK